ncbi:hypothetical protein QP415_03855 [Pauljensenia sp. UMB3104]|uniref:aldose epimerase family protein n=1 Tax=Pauljensenia sp. UMB3104 TaxID=3046331 RepID=UPI00254C2AA3|nr:hypothetical protein [Pauljensenia sp. UMB3104]
MERRTLLRQGPRTLRHPERRHHFYRADRVYTSTAQVQVVDPKLGRRIVVDKNGSGSTIVWNPWSQGAATMSDIGEGEWQNFVCVETAAVRERALTLWPGHPHIMTQTLAVESLD